MSVIITFLASVLVFGAVIAIHEFGHFSAAKLSGIQVNEYAIGMGPALYKKIIGSTQYTLRLLPIGGYVAMEGEGSPNPTPPSGSRTPAWKKRNRRISIPSRPNGGPGLPSRRPPSGSGPL